MSRRAKLKLVAAAAKPRRLGSGQARPLTATPHARGYAVAWRPGEANRCSGCGRSHWHVGRATAECAFCATALPILRDGRPEASLLRTDGADLAPQGERRDK